MDKIERLPVGEGGKETQSARAHEEKATENICKKCGSKKHKSSEHGSKSEAMKRMKK